MRRSCRRCRGEEIRNSVKSASSWFRRRSSRTLHRVLMAMHAIDSCFPRFLTTGVWPTGTRPRRVIGPAPRLICEEDLRPLRLGAFLNGRKCFLHPYPPSSLITLQRLVHRALRGEAEHLQDPADVLFRVIDPDLVLIRSRTSFLVHRPKLNSSWRGFRRRYLDSSSICYRSAVFSGLTLSLSIALPVRLRGCLLPAVNRRPVTLPIWPPAPWYILFQQANRIDARLCWSAACVHMVKKKKGVGGGVTLPLSLDQSLAGESFDRPAQARGLGLTM